MALARFAVAATCIRMSNPAGTLAPGFLVAVVIAIAAQFQSEHYGAPAMLMALLLGIAFNFLAEKGRWWRASSLRPARF